MGQSLWPLTQLPGPSPEFLEPCQPGPSIPQPRARGGIEFGPNWFSLP